MGPTVFILGTHTEEVYLERVTEFMEEGYMEDKDSKLLLLPHTLSVIDEGSAAVYDSRLLHCGGANRSFKQRVLFYFTVSNPKKQDGEDLFDPEGILDDDKQNIFDSSIRKENMGFTLKDFR